jgi:hypothetical protein
MPVFLRKSVGMTKNLLPRPGSRRFHAILDGDLPNFYDFRSKVARSWPLPLLIDGVEHVI